MNLRPVLDLLHNSYRAEEYPALKEQTAEWKKARPLEGLRLLDATPVYRNTLLKHCALLAAGAELTVGISPVMAHDPGIVRLLQECGIPVRTAEECKRDAAFDLILDCAGAFSPLIPHIGYVELTRSGAGSYRSNRRPVFFADGGRIKRIETCLGTGESYFRAMHRLGYDGWEGRRLVLFGCGKVGLGILFYAHKSGARTTVVTDTRCLPPQAHAYAERIVDYRNTEEVAATLQGAYAAVTATGVRHALAALPPEALTGSGALLANMGVEDEFGPQIAPHCVLNGKRTLNFTLEEPTRLRYIDATMALHNAGAVYLRERRLPQEYALILPPEETENEILAVTRRDGLLGEELELIG